jgi:hypothetical protein
VALPFVPVGPQPGAPGADSERLNEDAVAADL